MDDFYIKVRVKTNQKNETLEKIKEGQFVISIKEKPERNMANQKIVQLLQKFYGVNSAVNIINGHHHPIKLLKVNLKN